MSERKLVSQLTTEDILVSQLTKEDIQYLALAYDLDEDFVRTMTDIDFCAFLGCDLRELPFYLFASDEQVDKVFDTNVFDDNADFEDYDYSDPQFDLDYYIDSLPDTPITPLPPRKPYGRSTALSKPVKSKVPHYFVVVK